MTFEFTSRVIFENGMSWISKAGSCWQLNPSPLVIGTLLLQAGFWTANVVSATSIRPWPGRGQRLLVWCTAPDWLLLCPWKGRNGSLRRSQRRNVSGSVSYRPALTFLRSVRVIHAHLRFLLTVSLRRGVKRRRNDVRGAITEGERWDWVAWKVSSRPAFFYDKFEARMPTGGSGESRGAWGHLTLSLNANALRLSVGANGFACVVHEHKWKFTTEERCDSVKGNGRFFKVLAQLFVCFLVFVTIKGSLIVIVPPPRNCRRTTLLLYDSLLLVKWISNGSSRFLSSYYRR